MVRFVDKHNGDKHNVAFIHVVHNLTKMKKHQIIIILFLSIFIFSCKEKPEKTQLSEKVENLEPNVNIKKLESDFIKWWTYHSYNISLSSNFVGLNEMSDEIDKKQFLNELTSGNFIPLKLKLIDGIEQYKLYKLDSLADKSIRRTIKSESLTKLNYYRMEAMNFPEFDFTDLNGNHYTTKNTKGKTIILKTWFIHCQACVAEFPELNKLVEKYKNRKDIIFLSLATDSKPDLEKFLKKKIFRYEIVPNQEEFIQKTLNLQGYPTHIVINEKGKIIKVVGKARELISFLTRNSVFSKKEKHQPPPPPK